jgi:hypothetical protein
MENDLEIDSYLVIHRPSAKRVCMLRVRPICPSRLLGTEQTAGAVIFAVNPASQYSINSGFSFAVSD